MRVTITRVYDGSPALEAGLQEGDVVSMVDEYDASSMELSDLVSHIKGEEGTFCTSGNLSCRRKAGV